MIRILNQMVVQAEAAAAVVEGAEDAARAAMAPGIEANAEHVGESTGQDEEKMVVRRALRPLEALQKRAPCPALPRAQAEARAVAARPPPGSLATMAPPRPRRNMKHV